MNTDISTSKRQGLQHLEKIKDADFLDFLNQIRTTDGRYLVNQLPMTLKVDGIGARFGVSKDNIRFFESSRSGPITAPNSFSDYVKSQNKTDEISLQRALHYDNIYHKIIETCDIIESCLGNELLKNAKVHCEILYKPMAKIRNNRLIFVNLDYYDFPEDVDTVLIPLFVEYADTGYPHCKNHIIKQKLCELGVLENGVRFYNNCLTATQDLDITHLVKKLGDLTELQKNVVSKSRTFKKDANQLIQPIKQEISEYIINSQHIKEQYKLGEKREGIILYMKNKTVKVTSNEFKKIIANKNKCVVAYGSLMGHMGHQELVDYVLEYAKLNNVQPFVYISPMVGKDDPVSAETKLKTFQKLYPDNSEIFRIVGRGKGSDGKIRSGGIRGSIKFDLVPQGFTDITLVVGPDQEKSFEFLQTESCMKSIGAKNINIKVRIVNKSKPEHRSTQLRNILKTNTNIDEKLEKWCQKFDCTKLGKDWIKKIMLEAEQNM